MAKVKPGSARDRAFEKRTGTKPGSKADRAFERTGNTGTRTMTAKQAKYFGKGHK